MKAPRLLPLTLSLAVLAAVAAAAARGLEQQTASVVTYRPAPQKKGRPVDIPRGETLLALFLQQLADASGESVCLKSEEPADLRITVDRSLAQLDEATAGAVLARNGFEASRLEYRDREVIWVQRQIVPPRQKGRVLRPGESADDPPPPGAGGAPARSEPAATGGDGPAKLYAREAGSGPRYVVSFETDSRQEADTILALLRAHAEKARERRAAEGR